MYLVPKYPQYPTLYSTLIYLWGFILICSIIVLPYSPTMSRLKRDKTTSNGSHLEKWQPFCFSKWISYFSESVGSEALVYQIWCLYHPVKDAFSMLVSPSERWFQQSALFMDIYGCCISRTVIDTDMHLVPKFPQCPTLYSTSIHLWGLKSMHFDL